MNKNIRIPLIIVMFIIISGVIFTLFYTKEKPPVEEVKKAREKISEAKAANASVYSKTTFKNANQAYDSAMFYWNIENERFFLFRNYEKVRSFTKQAEELAASSMNQASSNENKVKAGVIGKIADAKNKVKAFHEFFENIPQTDHIRKQFNKGKLLLNEAQLSYEKADYNLARQKIDSATVLIEKSYKESYKILSTYFNSFPKWQAWVESTIELSRKNRTYCIVVDKIARECLLYHNGKLIERYEADLGKNWIGDKMQQGDYTTPEGIYRITDKKQGSRTQYHKALLINYPNDDDKARFAANKKNGSINARKSIGNLIEIHGHGGKGADWTEGCVALSNSDMDDLYSKCSVGTTVTIVGSLQPLDKIMKKL